jgi:hypothetical protein
MPGATETDFFARAEMLETKIGQGSSSSAIPPEAITAGI